MRLFSYTIPYDDGAAPNPYWGRMTLAICKPVIRRVAEKGDWIVGTGSTNSPIGDIQEKVVYLMEVTNKMTMQEYDIHCSRSLPGKIPDIKSTDLRKHVGDCIYDFTTDKSGKIRPSVHTYENRDTDLGGKSVLISDHFYYFGNKPLTLHKEFRCIIKPNQGHKSNSNDKIKDKFLKWFMNLNIQKNTLHGTPQINLDLRRTNDKQSEIERAKIKCRIDKMDEEEYRESIC